MPKEKKTDIEIKAFAELETIIIDNKQRIWQKINQEQIFLYWQVGNFVAAKLAAAQWGKAVVENFAKYFKKRHPQYKGFDKRAIYRMVQFYETYASPEFSEALLPHLKTATLQSNNQAKNTIEFVVAKHTPKNAQNEGLVTDNQNVTPPQIVVAKHTPKNAQNEGLITDNQNITKPQIVVAKPSLFSDNETQIVELLAHLSWSAHLEILSGCTTAEERLFYILLSKNEHLTYRELSRQIESSVYERTIGGNRKISSKLKEVHPKINNILKDRYMIDYLDIPNEHSEDDIQKGLLTKMKNFILDLGKDFLFVGEEHRVQVGMTDFFIDLLFYHRSLRCFVALELKATKFKPEYLGKLEFYLEALDRDVKNADENPSIGILLCKSADNEIVEYALSRSVSPTMIAKYERELISKELLRTYLKELD